MLLNLVAKSVSILPSFLLFFDKDNNYWIKLLNSKWKDFNWKPKKLKSYKFDKNIEPEIKPTSKKRHIRDCPGRSALFYSANTNQNNE